MKPLFYAGTSMHVGPVNPLERIGFFTDLSLKFGIPAKTGIMEDRDWENKLNHINDELTTFSAHDAYIQGAFLLDYAVGLLVPILRRVAVKGYAAFSYRHFSFASQDGYLQYAGSSGGKYDSWDASLPKTPNYGPAINYQQQWFILTPGVGVYIPLPLSLRLSLDVRLSPWIWCIALDDHFTKKMQYTDHTSQGGLLVEFRGALGFALNPRLEFSLSLGYGSIQGLRGPTYMRNTGTTSTGQVVQSGVGGTGFEGLDTGLSAKIRL
jgi:outer membrane protease